MAIREETAAEIGEAMIHVVKVFVALRQSAPRPHPEVEPGHYPVLFTLAREPQRVSDLAGGVHSDVSTVSRQAAHLARVGLVDKLPDPHDGRAQQLALSDEGRRVIAAIRHQQGQWVHRTLQNWSEADATQFLGHLTRFAGDMAATAVAAPPADQTTAR